MGHAYRLLFDEDVEHEVMDRLERLGHDGEHVDTVSELGKGSSDTDIGAYSIETDRFIVTYDDDFVLELDPAEYRAVLYFDDETTPAEQVAAIIDSMASHYPPDQVNGVVEMGREWL